MLLRYKCAVGVSILLTFYFTLVPRPLRDYIGENTLTREASYRHANRQQARKQIASLKRKQEALEFAIFLRLRKFPKLPDLTNNDMESECLTSKHTSRIETSSEKRSLINKGKSGKCGFSISLKPVKKNHKLPVKQTSRKVRSPEREKSKARMRGTGLVFLLFLCRTENLIIQWASENVLIEICHVFNIYYSGVGTS